MRQEKIPLSGLTSASYLTDQNKANELNQD